MRELTNKSTSIACELAALLMVVEECEVDQVERENLISWLDEYRINWRQAWSSRIQRGAQWITLHLPQQKICCYWRKRLPRFCHVLLTLRLSGRGRAYPCNEFNWPAQRLSDELANSLDISTFSDHESQEARS